MHYKYPRLSFVPEAILTGTTLQILLNAYCTFGTCLALSGYLI
jgi:hypothetical protein